LLFAAVGRHGPGSNHTSSPTSPQSETINKRAVS
jgi:hypothetical protein